MILPPRIRSSQAAFAAVAAIAICLVGSPGAFAATRYIAPSGSDLNACTSLAPCLSFNRGYQASTPGDDVQVAAGHYGNQTIQDDPSKDGTVAAVAIHPATGAQVTIDDLLSYASNVRYTGFTVDLGNGGQPDIRGGHDVVVENIRATNFYVQGPTNNVTIKGGEYGPYVTTGGGSHIKTLTAGGDDPNAAAQPHNTVVDGVYLHDYSVPSGSSAHLDCLHVFYHVAVTIKNSRFENCEHYGILLDSNGSGAAEHDVIQNNTFGAGMQVAGFALRGGTGEDFNDVLVQGNQGGTVTPQTTNVLQGVRFWDNTVDSLGGVCRSGIDYQRNVVGDGVSCGGTTSPPPPPPPPPATGPTVRYVATTGADSAACTSAAPCASIDRAYKVSSPGDTVEVRAGSYPAQVVNADSTKTVGSTEVLVRPAAGASVALADLKTYASDVHYTGFTFAGGQPNVKGGQNIVVENMKAPSLRIEGTPAGSPKNVTFKGGDYGPNASCVGGSQITPYNPDETQLSMMPQNITIDGVYFHDYTVPASCAGAHLDCLHIMPAANVVVRGSTFVRCTHIGLLLNSNGAGNVENDTIQNNFFGIGQGASFALREGTGEDFENVLVQNNSGSDIVPQTDNVLKNVRFVANAMDYVGPCRSDMVYQYNVISFGGCGSTDLTAAPGFIDLNGDNLHLKAGAAAIDRGKPGDYPAADIDGDARPQGPQPDAGADEVLGTTPPADTTPPDTSITSGPSGSTTATTAAFGFTASEAGSSFECRLDAGAWGSCATPKSYTGLTVGSHTFSVRGKDAAGNTDASPAARTWTITAVADTTPPDTAIVSGPSGSTTSTSASLTFSATETVTFECRLDAGAWGACASPKAYSGLAVGAHTFNVRATDTAGNVDLTPASRAWTVTAPADTTAPDTTITSGPTGSGTATSASLGFTASEAGSTFECRLDGGTWASCTSPKSYAAMAVGAHTFDVRATDAAGNTDASPATRSWTIVASSDTSPPDTTITGGPAASTTSTTSSVTFTSTESGSTFQCRLDGGTWNACASPEGDSGLAVGAHSMDVRATDAAGNVDPTPATWSWTVVASAPAPPADTTAPDTNLTSGPTTVTTSRSATFEFTATEDPATFRCSLDGSKWSTCASPKDYSSLSRGKHTIRVRGTDAAGNTDATPVSYSWSIVRRTYGATYSFEPLSGRSHATVQAGSLEGACAIVSGSHARLGVRLTGLHVRRSHSAMRISGKVPELAQDGVNARVRVSVRSHGRWHLITSRRVRVRFDGSFRVKAPRRAGKLKVTAVARCG